MRNKARFLVCIVILVALASSVFGSGLVTLGQFTKTSTYLEGSGTYTATCSAFTPADLISMSSSVGSDSDTMGGGGTCAALSFSSSAPLDITAIHYDPAGPVPAAATATITKLRSDGVIVQGVISGSGIAVATIEDVSALFASSDITIVGSTIDLYFVTTGGANWNLSIPTKANIGRGSVGINQFIGGMQNGIGQGLVDNTPPKALLNAKHFGLTQILGDASLSDDEHNITSGIYLGCAEYNSSRFSDFGDCAKFVLDMPEGRFNSTFNFTVLDIVESDVTGIGGSLADLSKGFTTVTDIWTNSTESIGYILDINGSLPILDSDGRTVGNYSFLVSNNNVTLFYYNTINRTKSPVANGGFLITMNNNSYGNANVNVTGVVNSTMKSLRMFEFFGTNVTLVSNISLHVYDSSDTIGGGTSPFTTTSVTFTANYTDISVKQPINNATCNLTVPGAIAGAVMNFASGLHTYSSTLSAGTHTWSVECSADGYSSIVLSDSITVSTVTETVVVGGGGGGKKGCSGSQSCTACAYSTCTDYGDTNGDGTSEVYCEGTKTCTTTNSCSGTEVSVEDCSGFTQVSCPDIVDCGAWGACVDGEESRTCTSYNVCEKDNANEQALEDYDAEIAQLETELDALEDELQDIIDYYDSEIAKLEVAIAKDCGKPTTCGSFGCFPNPKYYECEDDKKTAKFSLGIILLGKDSEVSKKQQEISDKQSEISELQSSGPGSVSYGSTYSETRACKIPGECELDPTSATCIDPEIDFGEPVYPAPIPEPPLPGEPLIPLPLDPYPEPTPIPSPIDPYVITPIEKLFDFLFPKSKSTDLKVDEYVDCDRPTEEIAQDIVDELSLTELYKYLGLESDVKFDEAFEILKDKTDDLCKARQKFETKQLACVTKDEGQTQVLSALNPTSLNLDLPRGYEIAVQPFIPECNGGDFNLKLNLAGNLRNVRAIKCTNGVCENVNIEKLDKLDCGGAVETAHRLTNDVINPEEFLQKFDPVQATLKEGEELVADNYKVKLLNTQSATVTLRVPTESVKQPFNKDLKIISTPLDVVVLNGKVTTLPVEITLPLLGDTSVDGKSLAVFSYKENDWLYVDSLIDTTDRKVVAQVDLIDYLVDGKARFALIGEVCQNCLTDGLEQLYAPIESTGDAVILVHGLGTTPATYNNIINDIKLTKQPWAVYAYSYPSRGSIDKNAISFADKLEQNVNNYDGLYIVGHSLGGVVAQKAIDYAREQNKITPDKYTFLKKTKKAILVGVPNDGFEDITVITRLYQFLPKFEYFSNFLNADQAIIDQLVKGGTIPKNPGTKYFAVAGTESYTFSETFDLTTDILFKGRQNDGIVTVESAQHIGKDYFTDICENFWPIAETHTELIHNDRSRAAIEGIIAHEVKKSNTETAILGGNLYYNLPITNCKSQDIYAVLGKKIERTEMIEDKTFCSCGNGYCGEGEDGTTCPVDCDNVFRAENVKKLQVWIFAFVLLAVPVYTVYRVYRRSAGVSSKRVVKRNPLKFEKANSFIFESYGAYRTGHKRDAILNYRQALKLYKSLSYEQQRRVYPGLNRLYRLMST